MRLPEMDTKKQVCNCTGMAGDEKTPLQLHLSDSQRFHGLKKNLRWQNFYDEG